MALDDLGELNDAGFGDFDTELEDEDHFDSNPPPGVEMLGMAIEPDYGSGSYAEDGRLEVAEDRTMMDGESQLGSAAMFGPTEIGKDFGPDAVGRLNVDDVGDFIDVMGAAAAADRLAAEIGAGYAPMDGQSEIGHGHHGAHGEGYTAIDGQSEIGHGHHGVHGEGYTAIDGQSEIGAHGGGYIASDGPSEIGYVPHMGSNVMRDPMRASETDLSDPYESFMLRPSRLGAADRGYGSEIGGLGSAAMYGPTEIGWPYTVGGPDDVGADIAYLDKKGSDLFMGAAAAADRPGTEIFGAAAVTKVIEKARDNRQPPPPMRAVDVDSTPADYDDWGLTDLFIGAAAASGNPNPFPITSEFMLRCGAGMEPRYVRVDTEETYKKFRAENSPELAALSARLEAHIADSHAHGEGGGLSEDVAEDIDDLVHLGAAVQDAEASKNIELWMPKRFDGLVTGWREGDFVCASLTLPGQDGELRICTSLEPLRKCVSEMSHHAADAGVPAAVVVGVLPAMGCVLGVGTALKEMAAAAPSILQHPKAAGTAPFMVRIEPKTSPALCALAMLVMACRAGNAQACTEWQNMGALAPAPVKQAMVEAMQLAKAA